MKRFMSENGPVDVVYLHGYFFGDRLLEGVLFKCVIDTMTDNVKVLGVTDECVPYFSQLNVEMWLSAAQKYAEQNDIFYTDLNEEAWIEE
jgi:hypothetical protein